MRIDDITETGVLGNSKPVKDLLNLVQEILSKNQQQEQVTKKFYDSVQNFVENKGKHIDVRV